MVEQRAVDHGLVPYRTIVPFFSRTVPSSATKTAQNQKGKEKKGGHGICVARGWCCWAPVMGRLSCRHGTVMPATMDGAYTAFPHIPGPFC